MSIRSCTRFLKYSQVSQILLAIAFASAIYITQLWKDSKDIEFVKQTIGHRRLDTTSAYVNQLSDQERQKRIEQLE